MSSLIQFDSSAVPAAPPTFGQGILPSRPRIDRDEIGNRVPVMPYNDADQEWFAREMASREAASWDAWTDALDNASRVTVADADELAAELELARMEAEWLASLELGRGPVTDYDVYPHGRI